MPHSLNEIQGELGIDGRPPANASNPAADTHRYFISLTGRRPRNRCRQLADALRLRRAVHRLACGTPKALEPTPSTS